MTQGTLVALSSLRQSSKACASDSEIIRIPTFPVMIMSRCSSIWTLRRFESNAVFGLKSRELGYGGGVLLDV